MKFRSHDEEKAALELQKPHRRDTSCGPKAAVSLDNFEIAGLMGQGSYGKVFLA